MQAGRVFVPASPVQQTNMFAGRITQIRKIVDAMNRQGQHVVIYGERGVGKTSIANILPAHLRVGGQPAALPKVSCNKESTFTSVWRAVAKAVRLHQAQRTIGFNSQERLSAINLEQMLPSGELSVDDVMHFLAKTGLNGVVIDEFDRICTDKARSGFADLIKGLSDYGIESKVILVGVADSVDNLLIDHQSIDRNLEQVKMPRMTTGEINEILDRAEQQLRISFKPAARGLIAELSQGLPHFCHLLGLHSVRAGLANRQLSIRLRDVESAVASAIEGSQRSLKALYHTATVSSHRNALFRQVLLACAVVPKDDMAQFAAADLREPLLRIAGRELGIPSYASHLNKFCSVDRGPILVKRGSARKYRYRFIDPMFPPFVKMRGMIDGLYKPESLQ